MFTLWGVDANIYPDRARSLMHINYQYSKIFNAQEADPASAGKALPCYGHQVQGETNCASTTTRIAIRMSPKS